MQAGNNHRAPLVTANAYEMGTTTAEEPAWLANPVRASINKVASEYMSRRWQKSRVARWDFGVTRKTLLNDLRPRPSDRILEIGCGPGTWTREVAESCKEVVAVDISENMITEAIRYTDGLPTRFIHGDFLESSPPGRYDKIFSCRAIEYIPDRALLAEKIADLLAPGGRVVLITKTRFSLWRGRMRLVYRRAPVLRQVGKMVGKGPEPDPHVRQYLPSPGQLATAFAPYGLAPVSVRPVVIRFPLFRNGFHEIPLIPEMLAAPFLLPFSMLHAIGRHMPRQMAPLPLLVSESFCITLEASRKS